MDLSKLLKVKDGCFIDKENNTFVKVFPKDKFNWGGYNFQKILPKDLTDGFEIAQFSGDLIDEDNTIITFTKLYSTKEVEINESNIKSIGCALGLLHKLGSDLEYVTNVKVKTTDYGDMSEWDGINLDSESEIWYKERAQIIKNLPQISLQNNKAILHRDFRKHNLLESEGKIILIDFDFTAIDYIAIELGAFITDLILANKFKEIKILKENYIKTSPELEGEITKSLEIYLKYLCASNFPWGNKSALTNARFNELKINRSKSFDTVKKIFNEGNIANFV